MSKDKCITYRYNQDRWERTTFDQLNVGDLIKIYDDPDSTTIRGETYWRVASKPYWYEEDNLGVECEPEENPVELETNNE